MSNDKCGVCKVLNATVAATGGRGLHVRQKFGPRMPVRNSFKSESGPRIRASPGRQVR